MTDLVIGQGETIRDLITVDEEGAVSATFVATDGTANVIEETFEFDGLEANIMITETIVPPAEYDYYYRIDWDDGSVDYIPSFRDCDGECSLPKLKVCEVPGVGDS